MEENIVTNTNDDFSIFNELTYVFDILENDENIDTEIVSNHIFELYEELKKDKKTIRKIYDIEDFITKFNKACKTLKDINVAEKDYNELEKIFLKLTSNIEIDYYSLRLDDYGKD